MSNFPVNRRLAPGLYELVSNDKRYVVVLVNAEWAVWADCGTQAPLLVSRHKRKRDAFEAVADHSVKN